MLVSETMMKETETVTSQSVSNKLMFIHFGFTMATKLVTLTSLILTLLAQDSKDFLTPDSALQSLATISRLS